MKNGFFFLSMLLCLTISTSQAQFSGKIVYEFEYQTQNNQPIEEVLNQPKIDSLSYWINEYAYKSVSYSNGEIVEEYVYDPTSKKMLFSMGNRPYYLFLQTDLDKFKSTLALEIDYANTAEILDFSTYQSINTATGEINYYAEKLQVDISQFSTHYFMQWNETLEKTNGSIPLKTITQQNGYKEIKTAIHIEEQDSKEMDFSFDKNRLHVAAYNNLDKIIDFPILKGQGFWCYQAVVEQYSNRLIDGKDYQLVLRFVIHPDGKITCIEIEESDYEYLNKAAIQIIETCELGFESGAINGVPTSSEIYYPINF